MKTRVGGALMVSAALLVGLYVQNEVRGLDKSLVWVMLPDVVVAYGTLVLCIMAFAVGAAMIICGDD